MSGHTNCSQGNAQPALLSHMQITTTVVILDGFPGSGKKKSEKVTEKNQHEFEVDTVLKKNSFQHLRAEFAAICNSACWDNEFKKSLAIYGQIQR